MAEEARIVTLKGNPLTLIGHEVEVGDKTPGFEVVDNDLNPDKNFSQPPKVYVLASVPSLDTLICDLETRWFNEESAKLSPGIALLTISMDLPFAQKRWCGFTMVQRVKTHSDLGAIQPTGKGTRP